MNVQTAQHLFPKTWRKALVEINLRTIGANYEILEIKEGVGQLRITYRPWATPLGVASPELVMPIKEHGTKPAPRSWRSGCGWAMSASDGNLFVTKGVQP